jgi:uncharacterized protein (DUF111 family)
MKTLYLDIFMASARYAYRRALIDLGVDAHKLERELKKLKLDGYHLHVTRKQKSGIEGVKFDVHLADGHDHHHHDDHDHEHTHRMNTVTLTNTSTALTAAHWSHTDQITLERNQVALR